MPELPEVETIKRDLNHELKGRKILKIKFYDWDKMLKPDPATLKKAIEGKKIKDFGRRAKLLLMHLDDHRTTIAIHLKMSGQLILKKDSDSKDRFNHVIIQLDKGDELHFNDLRKFGYLRVVKNNEELEKILSTLVPRSSMPCLRTKIIALKRPLISFSVNFSAVFSGCILALQSASSAYIFPTPDIFA